MLEFRGNETFKWSILTYTKVLESENALFAFFSTKNPREMVLKFELGKNVIANLQFVGTYISIIVTLSVFFIVINDVKPLSCCRMT